MSAHSRRAVLVALALTIGPGQPRPLAQSASPADARLWPSAVKQWIQRGEYAQAASWLESYLKKSPDPDFAYAYLYCLYRQDAYPMLLARSTKAPFSAALAQPRGHILAGLAHWQRGNLQQALRHWLVALAANPRDDNAWECMRVAILSAPRQQRTDLILALQKHPAVSKPLAVFLAGLLASVRGEPEQAEKHLHEAWRQFPESRAVARALQHHYRQRGDQKAALSIDRWLVGSRSSPATAPANPPPEAGAGESGPVRPSGRELFSGTPRYRLPWPSGMRVFCASHEGRRQTPHSGRGQYALDFHLPPAMQVLAARDGVVRKVSDSHDRFGSREFETFILIDHGDGTWGRYYHLASGSVRVRAAQPVRQGDILATVGRTGRCQSRHLHFEVLRKASWRLTGPRIYARWETIPIGFDEAVGLGRADLTGRWLVSQNGVGRPVRAGF